MKPTLITALILALAAAPVGAVVQPDKPKEEQPEKPGKPDKPSKPDRPSKPEPKGKPDKPGGKSKPDSRSQSRSGQKEGECPYTRLKENNWACVGFRPKPRPDREPVTDQDYFVPTGEKR